MVGVAWRTGDRLRADGGDEDRDGERVEESATRGPKDEVHISILASASGRPREVQRPSRFPVAGQRSCRVWCDTEPAPPYISPDVG